MAGEGRMSEVRVKRRYLGWIGKVDWRREGTKTRRSGETRRNGGAWEEITCRRILKGRLLLCRVSLKKAVKNRVQYHGERCNREQFIALWNTTF